MFGVRQSMVTLKSPLWFPNFRKSSCMWLFHTKTDTLYQTMGRSGSGAKMQTGSLELVTMSRESSLFHWSLLTAKPFYQCFLVRVMHVALCSLIPGDSQIEGIVSLRWIERWIMCINPTITLIRGRQWVCQNRKRKVVINQMLLMSKRRKLCKLLIDLWIKKSKMKK